MKETLFAREGEESAGNLSERKRQVEITAARMKSSARRITAAMGTALAAGLAVALWTTAPAQREKGPVLAVPMPVFAERVDANGSPSGSGESSMTLGPSEETAFSVKPTAVGVLQAVVEEEGLDTRWFGDAQSIADGDVGIRRLLQHEKGLLVYALEAPAARVCAFVSPRNERQAGSAPADLWKNAVALECAVLRKAPK